ncbi:MAG: hypothetical protein ACLVL7_12485 [Anaerotruncus massiliensis (ex Togo et al. 2019)]
MVKAAATGTMMSAANISIPWMKSDQQAAEAAEEGVEMMMTRRRSAPRRVEVEDVLEEFRAGAEGGGGETRKRRR